MSKSDILLLALLVLLLGVGITLMALAPDIIYTYQLPGGLQIVSDSNTLILDGTEYVGEASGFSRLVDFGAMLMYAGVALSIGYIWGKAAG